MIILYSCPEKRLREGWYIKKHNLDHKVSWALFERATLVGFCDMFFSIYCIFPSRVNVFFGIMFPGI